MSGCLGVDVKWAVPAGYLDSWETAAQVSYYVKYFYVSGRGCYMEHTNPVHSALVLLL